MFCAYSFTLSSSYWSNFSRKPHLYCVSTSKPKILHRISKLKIANTGVAYQSNTSFSTGDSLLIDLANTICKSKSSYQELIAYNILQGWHHEKPLVTKKCKLESLNFSIFGVENIRKEKATHLVEFSLKFSGNRYNFMNQPYHRNCVRHFKTDRSIAKEQERNPTITSKLKKVFGGSVHRNELRARVQNETLAKLLQRSGGKGSTKDAEAIKIAFAEGYLAANSEEHPKSGKTVKYLKVFQQLLVIAVFVGIFLSLFSSSNGSVFRIQLGNQVEVDPEEIHVTFDDVKGCDEAKQELKEVVEFLKNPEKFSNLGGKLPKGVLLVGPPGTGKTLLARAVAGEANVPFFHAAGPEFDEVLVGQGARRVRDLFKAAKQRAPCVIFIDEIDSVGAKRTNSVLHPYANQTINQLLSEMDGFHQNAGVIVLGATNRRDDLDQALLRPGRFDVEVVVSTPDFTGRKEILSLYLAKVLHDEIDLDMLARGTSGFTGADLENMINQAALRAAIDGAETVTMKHLETARDKVLMGPERKARLPDEEANLITAYHEGGHAIVAYYTKESHPLHKVTIMPRGPSLGHTAYIPEKERYHVTKAQLLAMMDTMMGGRAAEELIFGAEKITSGASSDLKQATSIATHMVKDWGMSEKVGLRTIESPQGLITNESLGPNTVETVDAEIKRILNESYERAKVILRKHAKEHKALAEALLKYETLDAEDIKAIVNGSQ